MTDTTDTGSSPDTSPIVEIQGSDKQSGSIMDAARTLASFREKQRQAPNSQASEAETPAAETPSGEQPEAAAAETQPPGETTETPETEPQVPAIEPPRSWAQAEKERFAALPRETQEWLANHERDRERNFRKGQDEAAEKLKGLTAKEQQVEQARQQYETALPALLQTLQTQQAGDFSDIKTIDDVTKLSQTDWPRYIQWDAAQKRLAAVAQQVQAAEQRQQQEKWQKLNEFMASEDKKTIAKIPELADPTKKMKLLDDLKTQVLYKSGFDDAELGQLARGEKEISLHDSRLMEIAYDALRWRTAEASKKTIQSHAKPLPPVQRPGVSQGKGAQQHANLEHFNKRLDQSGNVKDATRLLMEQRRARAG